MFYSTKQNLSAKHFGIRIQKGEVFRKLAYINNNISFISYDMKMHLYMGTEAYTYDKIKAHDV